MRCPCLESDTVPAPPPPPLPKDKIERKDIWRDNKRGMGSRRRWAPRSIEPPRLLDRRQWEKYQFESLASRSSLLNIQFIELWSNPVEVSLRRGGEGRGGEGAQIRPRNEASLEYTLHYATPHFENATSSPSFRPSLVHKRPRERLMRDANYYYRTGALRNRKRTSKIIIGRIGIEITHFFEMHLRIYRKFKSRFNRRNNLSKL